MARNKKEIIIMGIGRFSTELIDKINRTNSFNIVAIDKDQSKLEKLNGIKNTIVGDTTNRDFLLNIGIDNADYYIIGFGSDFQTSLTTASLLLENFKNGKVIAKSIDENHERILTSLGVHQIITPEFAAAKIVYKKLINPLDNLSNGNLFELIEIGHEMTGVVLPVLQEQDGLLVKDITLPNEVGIALISKNDGDHIVKGDTLLELDDKITLIGKEKTLIKYIEKIKESYEKNY